MPFDVAGARAAGYSDSDIATFLGQRAGFDAPAAMKAGYSAPDIVGFLSQAMDKPAPAQGDAMTRVDSSAPQDTSGAAITPEFDAGAGRGRVNPPLIGQNPETVQETADRLDRNITGSVISGVREMAGAAGVATMVPAKAIDFVHGLITGQDETGAQDYVGRTFIDPNFTAAEQWAPKPEDETHIAGKVLNGLARMAPTFAAAIATGGASAPEQGAIGMEAVRQAIANGMRSMSVPAFSSGIAKSADLIQKGAPIGEAVVAGLTEGATSDITGGLAMSTPGANAASRFVQGMAVGATTGDVSRQAQNIAAPDFQTPRTAEGLAISALSGGVLAAGMPHPADTRFTPDAAAEVPPQARPDIPPQADPIAKIGAAQSVDDAIQAANEAVAAAPSPLQKATEVPQGPTIEQMLADAKAKTGSLDQDLLSVRPLRQTQAAPEAAPELAPEAAPDLAADATVPDVTAPAQADPSVVWFGRAGDGYKSEADAQMALPSRLKIAPELDWKIEPMPNGKFRLAGYEGAEAPSVVGGAQSAAPEDAKPLVESSMTQAPVPTDGSSFQPGDVVDSSVPFRNVRGGVVVRTERRSNIAGEPADVAIVRHPDGNESAELVETLKPAKLPDATLTAPDKQGTTSPLLAPEVSRYNGKFGKGMGRDAARLEAARLNRQNDGVTYAAEEHGDPNLENPYAVVGRAMGHELPDARDIDAADAEHALNDITRGTNDDVASRKDVVGNNSAASADDSSEGARERKRRVDLAEEDYRLPNIGNAVPRDYVPAQAFEREVTVYRGVPKNLADATIRPGDWISLDRKYAAQHGTGETGASRIISMKVPADHVVWAGTDMNEWFYAPRKPAIDDATGLPLNADGTVTVYHHTSREAADQIRKTGTLKADAEPDVYVTTRKEADTGYGDTAVPIRVKPDALSIDDEFPNGRKDFRLNVGKPGGSIKVDVRNESTAPNRDGADLNDFARSGDTLSRLAYQGYEKAEVPRVQAARRLQALLDRYDNNKISDGMFQLELKMLSHQMTAVSETKQTNRLFSERERGADMVRERLINGRRTGALDSATVDFGLWLLDRNPELASGLGISLRQAKDEKGSAGRYNPASRVITLFKERANDGTAVHEILHHSERMMPEAVQKGIASEWAKAFADAAKKATPEQKASLQAMAESMAGSHDAQKSVLKAFRDGTLNYDEHYQLTNPSEFWAVNATRILKNRFDAGSSWVGKARQWLSEFTEKAKNVFGLRSDAAVISGLRSVLNGDGEFQSKNMLTKADALGDIKSASDEERTANVADRVGAGYHAYAGVERIEPKASTGIADSIAKALVPAGRKDASITAGIIRGNLGEQARGREVAQQKLMEFAKQFDRTPVAENYKFIDAMERGVPLKDPELARAAVALRKVLDERRDQVIALGKGNLENFNENYFPHIWKDKTAASNVFTRRPLEGGKGFLKQRTYDYFADGIKAGLEPVTTNPVELAMLKAREMDRYIYGQRIFQEMKDAGVAKFVGFGAKAPEGWVKINDKIARVMQYSEAEKGMILRGEYYAPEQAATLINNHLSPGLSGIAAFDMIRRAGNMMNGAQLGLSAFHLGFTTLDAMISKAALGVKQASRGDVIKGVGNIAQSLNPAQPVMNLIKGDRLLKAYLGNLNDPELAPIVESLVQAGGRVKMDDVYRNAAANEFRQAIRKGNYGTAAMKALPRLMDLINKPIFEYLVPRQKLGVFFDMAKDALEAHPDMSLQEKRQVMGKLWDSVDNRMGELVYDNVFWNRALKDALMVSVRSVGWNLGTFREIGGGIKDIKDIPKIGGLSDRTSYIFALTFVTAVIGSLTQYMMTGDGPKELKDVFFPRTGKDRPDGTEDRLSLPSYMKDIYEYGHDLRNFVKYGDSPFNTLANKLHPLISTMAQVFTNKDFFGGAIRSPGDTSAQQALDEADYMLKQMTPFSVRNYLQQAKVKGEEPSVLGYLSSPSMIGITPSPGYITKTDEQSESSQVNRMREALTTKFREEIRDGADWAEIRQRAIDAGLSSQDLAWIRKAAVQRPPRRLKAFADH